MKLNIVLSLLVYVAGIAINCLIAKQDNFVSIIISYSITFLGLIGCYFSFEKINGQTTLFFLTITLIPLFTLPNLSDDIYRFYWDGVLIKNGISPYSHLPSQLIQTDVIPEQLQGVFSLLNSPEYYSIYPPLNQLIFYLASFGGSILAFTFLVKLLYVALHFVAWQGWRKYISQDNRSLYYFANPLVIIEGIGNLHVEIVMVSLLIWTYIFFKKNQPIKTALYLGLAVSIKLLPLMILPYLLFYYRKKYQLFTFLFTFSVVIFVCFLPLFLGLDLTNIFNSIDLYFRKFEFNASIYYLQRWLGFQLSGYNLIAYIGPLNGLISFAIIMYFSYILAKKKDDSFFQIGYIAFMIYLLLSPIIHPWYIMTPLLFSINLRHWHVIAWSYLAILSYAHYHEGRFTERYWLLFLEYGLLCTIYLLEKKFVVNS